MIKLNNKNITYVALADSSNSLKAPKEIWYADSNNSVKLVYRRKDALIEGEDYEKYHWLEGRNGAYINTNHKLVTIEDSLHLKARKDESPANPDGYYQMLAGYCSGINRGDVRVFVNYTSIGELTPFYCVLGTNNYGFLGKTNDFDISIRADNQNYYTVLNGSNAPTYSTEGLTQQQYGDVYLFRANGTDSRWYFHGDIAYFKITDNSSNTKMNLIPCKLLKPVPKWLDANGIRRQVGECGMIDLVSGKFYGNVNSVGTFTVENYYERKEWLQGRNGAYINTNHKLVTIEDRFDIKYHILDDGISGISKEIDLFGYTDKAYPKARNVIFTGFNSRKTFANYCYDTYSVGYILEGLFDGTLQIYADTSNMHLIINGVEQLVASTNGLTQQQMGDVYLFDVNLDSHGNHPFNGDIAYFKITDTSSNTKMNLIPCTLTMDLPASMDANNIARTKGTSGMWDLVSDKFYGNVANSGTFKAVNLAEGVDYEVHQWLRTEVNTKATLMTLDINSYSFSFSRKPLSGSNVPYFITEGLDVYLYSDSDNTIRIWNASQGGYYYSNTPFNWGDTISITSSNNSLVVNSRVIPQNTFPVHLIYFGANNTNGAEHYTSSITVDGIERYIPVKLLRSIPSKYDANGIARQAGECGMYDTVNDKFYGNVASSGTFSVEDDS